MKTTRIVALTVLIAMFTACHKSNTGNEPAPPIPPSVTDTFVRGADISWLTQMEASGRKFYNASGAEQDCIQILKALGMNTIRLRVWVNPSNGWNGQNDVIAKAVRAKNLGMKVMIDFHYSDSWADPGQQTKPAAWTALDFSSLKQSLISHTATVLNGLKSAGVTPTWVQIGNETNDGMLWPDGKASTNMTNFAQLVSAGYTTVKAVDPSIKVIIHISNGWNNALFRWIFDGLKNNGVQWDVIGMSLYPSSTNWSTLNTQCLTNMNDMVSRYSKEVMVVEVGMSWDQANACNAFLTDLITKVKSVSNGKGLGVLYWEPESYNNWQGYTLGAFDNSGKPTIALNAFK
jgi:arabinogalactan endo-1,4-beta-galactosidase